MAETWTIALLGPSTGGKTMILNQFIKGVFREPFYGPTVQDTWHKVAIVDEASCSLQITETSGLEEYQMLEEQVIRESEAFVFVYRASSRWTYDAVRPFYERMVRVKRHAVPCVLVATESDGTRKKRVRYNEGLELSFELECQFFQVSCEENVDAPFHALVQMLRGTEQLDRPLSHIQTIALPHSIHGTSTALSVTLHPSLLAFSTGTVTSNSGMSTLTSANSGDTIWGPGALAGKALIAFGEATLRAVENLVVRRRLSSIRSSLSRRQSGPGVNLKSIVEDLLELSRVGLYPSSIRNRALRILVQFTKDGDLDILTECLTRWPTVEIQIFVSALSDFVNANTVIDQSRHILPSLALLRVCWALAQADASVFRSLVDLGLLDMTLSICSLAETAPWETALDICFTGIAECQRVDNSLADFFRAHPLHYLWPSWSSSPTRNAMGDVPLYKGRRNAWDRVDRRLVGLRLEVIQNVLDSSVLWTNGNRWNDVVMDLLTFTSKEYGDQHDDTEVRNIRLADDLLKQFFTKGKRYEVIYRSCCEILGQRPTLLRYQIRHTV